MHVITCIFPLSCYLRFDDDCVCHQTTSAWYWARLSNKKAGYDLVPLYQKVKERRVSIRLPEYAHDFPESGIVARYDMLPAADY